MPAENCFLIDVWRQSTAYTDMTLAEQGAYRNLIDEVVLRPDGIIPDGSLAKASGSPEEWHKVSAVVMKWMRRVNGGWTNDFAVSNKGKVGVAVERGIDWGSRALVTLDKALCPDCSQAGTFTRTSGMGSRPEAWYCNPKLGGCSSNFALADEAVLGQLVERVAAPIRNRVAAGRDLAQPIGTSKEGLRKKANKSVFDDLRGRIGVQPR